MPVPSRADEARSPFSTVISCIPRSDQPAQPTVDSGSDPPVNGAPELQTSQMPELPQIPMPQLPALPSLAPLPPVAQPVIQGFQAINAIEVIDLTGLSDYEDGGDWEDVPEIIDLTNLSSDEDDGEDDDAGAEELGGALQNYTILNLPSRRYTVIDRPPITAPTRPRRRARVPARVPTRVPTRVPVRRHVCELCARVVRWGPGCLITKHHLYPQEVTKKYAGRYTNAQKCSIALLCRPCHDACHRTHSNRTLADFYYEVDLLKADPNIQAHIRSMQRATTPELIQRYGDGVNVRGRKHRMRAARASEERRAAERPRLTEVNLRALAQPSPPSVRRSARLTETNLRVLTAPSPPPGARRSARLLGRSTGSQQQVPVIVIEDDDENMQSSVIHENIEGRENEKVQDTVSQEGLAALAELGEYIPL